MALSPFFIFAILDRPSDSVHVDLKRKMTIILNKTREQHEHKAAVDNAHHLQTHESIKSTESVKETPRFTVRSEQDGTSSDGHNTLLGFFGSHDYKPEFQLLYSAYPEFILLHFQGRLDEEELVAYLGVARETARKKRMSWAQSRICFLLGQLCGGRSKFSQARVYYEEALSIPKDYFKDTYFLSAIYSNLAYVYFTQKNVDKFIALSERFAALMMAVCDCLTGTEDSEVLKFALKKAVLSKNKPAEARVCFLLGKFYLKLEEGMNAVPFIERLQILADELPGAWDDMKSHGFLLLARLYSDYGLLHLAESSAQQACIQVCRAMMSIHLSSQTSIMSF